MDFKSSKELEEYRAALRNFINKEMAPYVDEVEEREERRQMEGFDCEAGPDLIKKLKKDELLVSPYPPKGSMMKYCVMMEELGYECPGWATPVVIMGGFGTRVIYKAGTDEQKQKFLHPCLEGEKISAFGLTEPYAGSDVAGIQTTAAKDENYYVLNGEKMFIANGTICDFVVVTAKTNINKGIRGLSSFVVEKGTPGFTAKRQRLLGWHSCDVSQLYFKDCRIPKEALIGEEGTAFYQVMDALNFARVTNATYSIGITRAALDAAINYANKRRAFGKTISEFQGVSFKLADIATKLEAAKLLRDKAAWMMDQDMDMAKEAAMAKLFASELATIATSECLQVFGGMGYTYLTRMQRYFRDARMTTIGDGTSNIMRYVITRRIGLNIKL